MSTDFNPIKEEIGGKKAMSMIWSTKTLDMALQGLEQGKKLIANPFYENQTKLLKGDLVFKRTPEEIEEFKKCMNDIIYFANKYCKLMTPEGIKNVSLRDYQEEYLKHLIKNRLSIFLSCRQSGKCVDFQSVIWIKDIFESLNQEYYEKYHKGDVYELPLFELIHLYQSDDIAQKRYELHKAIYDGDVNLYKELAELDKQNDGDEKIVWSHILNGCYIKTPSGFVPASYIHMTKPFDVYTIKTANGLQLNCADEHLLFNEFGYTSWVTDFQVGDKIQTQNGLDTIISIVKQDYKVSMCDVSILEENESYYTNGILSHNTTTSAVFLLHYILFNTDKNALVLGNKRKTAIEILDKVKKIFLEIPYFLKPGVYRWNEGSIVFDNGCRCMAEATTINSGISFTFHCVLADEFAHIPSNIVDSFYNNLFPTIVSGRNRLILTSTQNGYNLFYRLYTAAVAGENEYKPFKVDWWQVPEWNPEKKCWEKRDEEWHKLQVANYGSEEAFNKQFGTSFSINSNTLIATKVIQQREQEEIPFINKDLAINYGEYFFWDPDVEVEEIKNKPTCITIDIAEGIGGDYTTYTFNSLKMIDDKVHSEAYGYFHCNDKNVQECVQILKDFCIHYMDINNFVISLEYNLYGELFVKCMLEEIEKDTPNMMKFNEDVFLKYFNEERTRYTMGKKITAKSKLLGLSLFKNQYEHGVIVNRSAQFLNELTNFCDNKGNNTYQASYGHDDLVMSQMHIVFATENQRVKELAQMEMVQGRGYSAYNPYDMIGMPTTGFYDFSQPQNVDLNAQRLNRFS